MLKPCEHCGAENPALAKFCRQCGRPWPQPALRSATADSPVMQQWRRLKQQMTRKEVRTLLGEPARIEPGAATDERWTYEYDRLGGGDRLAGHVGFAVPDGVVTAWVEPDWRALREPASDLGDA